MTPSPDPRYDKLVEALRTAEVRLGSAKRLLDKTNCGYEGDGGAVNFVEEAQDIISGALAEAQKPLTEVAGLDLTDWLELACDSNCIPHDTACRAIAAILEPKTEEKA